MTPHLAGTPVLQTQRLTLRAPAMQDWARWCAFIVDDPRARFVRGADIDLGKAWRAFGHAVGMWALRGYGSFVFCLRGSDDALGMTGPWHPMDWPERELGWTVWQPEAEGKGLAFEAAARARDFAFRDLGWKTAVSYIDPGNARSIALAERLGAVRDPQAEPPVPLADMPALVFRHPAPGAAA